MNYLSVKESASAEPTFCGTSFRCDTFICVERCKKPKARTKLNAPRSTAQPKRFAKTRQLQWLNYYTSGFVHTKFEHTNHTHEWRLLCLVALVARSMTTMWQHVAPSPTCRCVGRGCCRAARSIALLGAKYMSKHAGDAKSQPAVVWALGRIKHRWKVNVFI